jgi:hypothetical protein
MSEPTFLEFNLRFESAGGSCRVRVIDSPFGQATGQFPLPLTLPDGVNPCRMGLTRLQTKPGRGSLVMPSLPLSSPVKSWPCFAVLPMNPTVRVLRCA